MAGNDIRFYRSVQNPVTGLALTSTACDQCDKQDLKSSVLCLFPDIETIKSRYYDRVLYNGEMKSLYLYQYFLKRVDENLMNDLTYMDIVSDLVMYIEETRSVLTSDNNNGYNRLNLNTELALPDLTRERREFCEYYMNMCYCMQDIVGSEITD